MNEQDFTSTQNSTLRDITRNPIELSANWLVDNYPGLRATHITLAGTAGALAVGAIAERYPGTARLASWAHLASSLTDAWDGPVARAHGKNNSRGTSLSGSLIDTASDRLQEFAAGTSQASIAFARGNKIGGYAQLAFAGSSLLPSLTRSLAESRGNVVSEGAIGSRHTRVTLNCLGYFWNEEPKRVTALGAVGTGLNLYNAAQRLDSLRTGSKNNLGDIDPQKKVHAKIRLGMLSLLSIAGGVNVYKKAKRSN